MDNFRDKFEHHWIIEMTDEGITEARDYFVKFFKGKNADFFECNETESKKRCYIDTFRLELLEDIF